jgi:hypothetical protein
VQEARILNKWETKDVSARWSRGETIEMKEYVPSCSHQVNASEVYKEAVAVCWIMNVDRVNEVEETTVKIKS